MSGYQSSVAGSKIALFFAACDVLDHDSDGGGQASPFYLVDDTGALTERYRNSSVGTVVSLSFNKPVNREEPGGGAPVPLTESSVTAFTGNDGLIKIFEADTLREVAGDLHVSGDGSELIFVPRGLLLPCTGYRVLLSSRTKSVDNEYLDRNYTFELTTGESGDVVAVMTGEDAVVAGSAVAFSADPGGPGAFGDATCFSVMDSVATPNIAGVALNETEFSCVDGMANLTFNAQTFTTDCPGGFTGTLEYEIRDDQQVAVLPVGSFEKGVPFTVALAAGNYFWKARHVVAGLASDWSEVLAITLREENRRPVAANVTPAEGTLFGSGNEIVLAMSAQDPDEDPLQSRDFQYDQDPLFSEPAAFVDLPANSVSIGTLTPGIYYWRGRAADAQGYGDWSAPTCFSVIESVTPPLIADADNASEFQGDGETVTLTFRVNEGALDANCHGEPAGTLFYEISADADFMVTAADGDFLSGVPFTEWLSPGTYYWRARHVIGGLESEWSESLAFAVTGETQELLLLDEDFEAGIGEWTQVKSGVGTFVLEAVDDGGDSVFHYKRYNAGTSGGETGIQQTLNTDITGYSEVYVEFDVKLMSYSLSSSGQWTYQNGGTGEWPADVKIYFTDLDGNNQIWNNGFLNGADSYGRTNYTSIGLNVWYHYRSPNLRTVKTTRTGPYNAVIAGNFIGTINVVRIGGGGWNFEGEFDAVRLILSE